MAGRRCFAASVVESDRFLELPFSAQALYFHLGMCADDDGFIGGTRRVCSMTGANMEDVQALIDSGFIILFKSKVVCDRYWKINNTLQNDRYKPTVYLKEKEMLVSDTAAGKDGRRKSAEYEVKKECVRYVVQSVYNTDTKCIQNVSNTDSECVQNGNITELNITEQNSNDIKRHVQQSWTSESEEGEEDLTIEELRKLNPKLSDDDLERLDTFFNELWSMYPKKEQKKRAKKQFFKLNPYDRVVIKMVNEIQNYLIPQCNEYGTNKHVPLLENWLLDRRWKDGI